jgi:hypothetical protein
VTSRDVELLSAKATEPMRNPLPSAITATILFRPGANMYDKAAPSNSDDAGSAT